MHARAAQAGGYQDFYHDHRESSSERFFLYLTFFCIGAMCKECNTRENVVSFLPEIYLSIYQYISWQKCLSSESRAEYDEPVCEPLSDGSMLGADAPLPPCPDEPDEEVLSTRAAAEAHTGWPSCATWRAS